MTIDLEIVSLTLVVQILSTREYLQNQIIVKLLAILTLENNYNLREYLHFSSILSYFSFRAIFLKYAPAVSYLQPGDSTATHSNFFVTTAKCKKHYATHTGMYIHHADSM
jgi:hypothetical protein